MASPVLWHGRSSAIVLTVVLGWSAHAAAASTTAVRISRAPDGAPGNGPSEAPATGASGFCVAFQSAATNLVAGDTNALVDVFVGGRSQAAVRVSVASDGAQADGHSTEPAVSGDCRYVAFTSQASNLVTGDTNGVADVFVHDRLTQQTARVSVEPGGEQRARAASSPSLSADGRFLAYDTAGDPLVGGARVFVYDRQLEQTVEIAEPAARDLRQPTISADGRFVAFMSYVRGATPGDLHDDGVWLHDRATGETRRVATAPAPELPLIGRPALSGDGGVLAFAVTSEQPGPVSVRSWRVHLFERATGRTTAVGDPVGWSPSRDALMCSVRPCGSSSRPSLDASGRLIAVSRVSPSPSYEYDLWVVDRHFWTGTFGGSTIGGGTGLAANAGEVCLSANGRSLVASIDEWVPWVPYEARQIVSLDLDGDMDGLPTSFEDAMGLDDTWALDATLDSDGDGLTNLAEFQAGSHPLGFFRQYLAEGATGDFFSTALTIDGSGPVGLTFQRSDGSNVQAYRVGPSVVEVAGIPGLERAEFSTVIEAAFPFVVDRTMTWDRSRYGGHAETGMAAPQTTWYFAEGATHAAFDLFYLIQNPGSTPADVKVTYLLPAPAEPIEKRYVVGPASRLTIWVDHEDAALASTAVSSLVESINGVPILAERAMYSSGPEFFAAGHAGAGIAALSTEWFFAEGATGDFFDEFLTIANPGREAADLEVTYLLPGGEPLVVPHVVPASSRYTIWVDHEHPRLAQTAVSAVLRTRNGIAVAAERVMWWPGAPGAGWREAHVVAGAPRARSSWWVTGGRADATTDTFVLIGNPSNVAATARVTVLQTSPPTGPSVTTRDYVLAPGSRVDVWVNADFGLRSGTVLSVAVDSDAEIVVERASYWGASGVPWAAGVATMASARPSAYESEDEFVAAVAPNQRASFDTLPTGPQVMPVTLDGITFELLTEALTQAQVRPPSGDFSTNYLDIVRSHGNDLTIVLAPGTRAVGLRLSAPSGASFVTAVAGDGTGRTLPLLGSLARPTGQFVGFASPAGITRIRVTSRRQTIGGRPMPATLQIGDVLWLR